MKISRTWLNEFITLGDLSTQHIADVLTAAGLEVDSIEKAAGEFSNVVVAEIVSFEKHPDADKLNVCQVSDGETVSQVVCGAKNVKAAMKVAFAKVGAKLPEIDIKKAKLRGVESHGMLCAYRELGLGDIGEGIIEFSGDAPVGEPVCDYLALDDDIIDIDLTPNRGDCLSVLGIARELSMLLDKPLTQRANIKLNEEHAQQLTIDVKAPTVCPRYMGRLLFQINNELQTPVWLMERLRRSGLRSISLVVDVLNHVMIETGQPLHAFDADKLTGGITVRMAKANEKIALLDETEVALDVKDLVIADDSGPQALAGIMGGLHTSVTNATQAVFIESAYFAAPVLAKTALRHNIHSDAEHRFVRGVDFELPRYALDRASQLLCELSNAQLGTIHDVTNLEELPQRNEIELAIEKVSQVIGVDITEDQIESCLLNLGMKLSRANKTFYVKPPSYRFDMVIMEDLIEEVMRLYGYDKIEEQALSLTAQPQVFDCAEYDLKSRLAMRDYQEVISYSFISYKWQQHFCDNKHSIPLVNPLSNELAVMRGSLMPSLVMTAIHNLKRQQTRCRLFEMGKQYVQSLNGIEETMLLAGLVLGNVNAESWGDSPREVDFYDVKADIESLLWATQSHTVRFCKGQHVALHPEQTADIICQDKVLGVLGLMHPQLKQALGLKQKVYLFELNADLFNNKKVVEYRPVSKFPSVRRDFAIVVDKSVTCQALLDEIEAHAGQDLQDVIVFDVYTGQNVGKNKKSVAIGLILQDPCRTLKDEEVNDVADQVLTALTSTFNAKLRDA